MKARVTAQKFLVAGDDIKSYNSDETGIEVFRRLTTDLTEEDGLVFFDPLMLGEETQEAVRSCRNAEAIIVNAIREIYPEERETSDSAILRSLLIDPSCFKKFPSKYNDFVESLHHVKGMVEQEAAAFLSLFNRLTDRTAAYVFYVPGALYLDPFLVEGLQGRFLHPFAEYDSESAVMGLGGSRRKEQEVPASNQTPSLEADPALQRRFIEDIGRARYLFVYDGVRIGNTRLSEGEPLIDLTEDLKLTNRLKGMVIVTAAPTTRDFAKGVSVRDSQYCIINTGPSKDYDVSHVDIYERGERLPEAMLYVSGERDWKLHFANGAVEEKLIKTSETYKEKSGEATGTEEAEAHAAEKVKKRKKRPKTREREETPAEPRKDERLCGECVLGRCEYGWSFTEVNPSDTRDWLVEFYEICPDVAGEAAKVAREAFDAWHKNLGAYPKDVSVLIVKEGVIINITDKATTVSQVAPIPGEVCQPYAVRINGENFFYDRENMTFRPYLETLRHGEPTGFVSRRISKAALRYK